MNVQTEVLASWADGAARRAIAEFVERTVSDGVPVEERVVVFDNDGTLWCEKAMPIQADFILRRLGCKYSILTLQRARIRGSARRAGPAMDALSCHRR
jgi:hypothetical protein